MAQPLAARADTAGREQHHIACEIAELAQILAVSADGTVYTGTASASPLGGWNVQAATYALWEPLVAWGVILGLVHLFEQRFLTLGPAWSALAPI